MTEATTGRKTSVKTRLRCDVVLLDARWTTSLPGVERLVRRAARTAVTGARRPGVRSIVVALADDRRVRRLNERDRGKDKPTNVLSYPSGLRDFAGDIVVARQTVWREARAQKKKPADHLTHLVVHGVLHLLGYDHEDDLDAERMEGLERRLLAKLGIADPYGTP